MKLSADVERRLAALSPDKRELVLRRLQEQSAMAGLPRAPRDQRLPLSSAQQRLWILSELEGASATYNVGLAIHFEGPLDRPALGAALGQLVARHEILRTIYVRAGDGSVEQRVVAAEAAAWRMDESRTADAPDALRAALEAGARAPFDLGRDLPVRATLYRAGGDHHVLALVLHHIATDGWSMGVLVEELAALYRSARSGTAPPLAPVDLHYADYAAWERAAPVAAESLDYWRRTLAGASRSEILTDHPRSGARSTGRSKRFTIEAAAMQRLRSAADEAGASTFAATLAAFSILLSRWSGRTDVVVGCPFANRPRASLERMPGFFVNTLPVRVQAGGGTFADAVRRAHEAIAGAISHQTVPFDRVVDACGAPREADRTPFFQAVLSYQPAAPAPEFDGLRAWSETIDTGTSKFDITLVLDDSAAGCAATIEYNAALFDEPTIERLAGGLLHLVRTVTAPTAVDDIDILPADERARLLDAWSGRTSEYPRDASIVRVFDAVAEASPARVAVAFGTASLTFGELQEQSRRIAAGLAGAGVGRGSIVAVNALRSATLVPSLLGVLRAGAAYLPIDPAYPRARVALLLGDAGVTHALSDDPRVFDGAGVRTLAPGDLVREVARTADVETTADDIAYVVYTSGSTGEPKGVRVPHRAVLRLACGNDFIDAGPDDVFLQLAPVAFDASTLEIWGALLIGARLAVAPAGQLSVDDIAGVLAREGVTVLWLTSGLFNLFVDERLESLSGVRQLLAGGDVLSVPHVLRAARALPRTRIVNGYGPTENTTFTGCYTVDPSTAFERGIPIGRPIANTTVYILDERLRPVPVGVAGELYAGGDGLADGYLNQPALTRARFVPNPFGPGRLYRTGDRARWTSDGVIEFLGRLDEQVKIRGFRVEPGEVEATLLQLPGIRQAAVTVQRTASSAELVAYVVGDPGAHLSADDVRRQLSARLPAYLQPAAIVPLDALPLTPNGKVDRAALPAAQPRVSGIVPLATPTEEYVAALFRDLLGVPQVGAESRFFDLGGNSLGATQLVARVAGTRGIRLPLRVVFESPDVRGIAATIDAVESPARGVERTIPVTDRSVPLPLSFAQERLWFLNRLEPDNPFYNIAVAVRLAGALDPGALQAALDTIVARHEVLRTRYVEVDGRPAQIVDPAVRVVLHRAAASDAELERLAREEARHSFDLAAGPVLRATLAAVESDVHVLFLTIHHIAADGWSMGVLVRELSAAYAAAAGQATPPLDDLPVQYGDFAAWQRQASATGAFEDQERYWMQQLAGFPRELALPADRVRPAAQTFRGGSVRFEIDAATARRLGEVARAAGATPFMVLLAAFAAVLARQSGQQDLVIGSPIANRTHRALEGLVGFFVNTLALRIDLSGDPTFRQLVDRARRVALDAYASQDVPFERIVDRLQPERDLSRNPLFNVMFALQNAPMDVIALPGLDIRTLEHERTTAQFDLVLDMWEPASGEILSVLEYSTDLFDRSTAHRLARQLQSLAAAAGADPDIPVSRLPLLSEAEKRAILDGFNTATGTFPTDRTLHQLFEDRVDAEPLRAAAEHNGAVIGYAALNSRANRIGHRLRRMGVGRNDFVAIVLDRGLDCLAAMLGILKAGGAFVPVDPTYPADRVRYMLDNAAPRAVITDRRRAPLVEGAGPVVLADDPQLESEETGNPAPLAGPRDRAYMLFTSGSTGAPKGAILRHDGKINHIYAQFRWLAFHRDSVFLQTAPASSDISVWQFIGPLLIGGRTVIVDTEMLCDPPAFWQTIRDSGATIIELVPVAMAALLEHAATLSADERAATRLEWAMATGETVSPSLVNRWIELFPAVPLVNAYGPTEAADDVCQFVVRRPLPGDARSVPVGTPLANLRLYVLDANLEPQPIGVPGEICVSGIGVGEGYWRDAERTRERFVANPHAPAADRTGHHLVLYRTGDVGYWRPDGVLECLSRIDTQVKIRGFRIELGEIEAAVTGHPSVRDAVVIAREDAPGDRRLVAYVVPNTNAPEVAARLAEGRDEQVGLWTDLHEGEYRQRLDYGDPTFNVIGWDSSYTNEPLAREEMVEYVEGTAARILSLAPKRLLEIGCGTGLLMFRVAPGVERYTGVDLSSVAIDRLRTLTRDEEVLRRTGPLDHVRLHAARADRLPLSAGDAIDTVIFPSVVQYFPGIDYLLQVLDRIVPLMAPGGALFFGDVRSLPLLDGFYRSLVEFKAEGPLAPADVRERIRILAEQEQEMAIDPAFFDALRHRYPSIADVRILPKDGRIENEMTRYRVDVIVRFAAGETPSRQADSVAWSQFANNPLHERIARAIRPLLRDHLRTRLPHYMVPSDIVVLGQLPTTPAGKVDRQALPAPGRAAVEREDALAPRTPTEAALAGIWQEVLGLETCPVHGNFFDLGGHSLKATQVVSRIRQRLDVELPLRAVFAHPTVAELAVAVGQLGRTTTAREIPRVADAPHYPLSAAQRRLWILSRLDDGSVAYNMPASLLLDGELDVARLQRAIAQVVARHESLRTTFIAANGEPRQVVSPPAPFDLPVLDLSGEPDPEAAARHLAAADAQQPFDFVAGPLFRVSLARLGPARHVLLVNVHHIVSDDWSTGVLVRDVMTAYDRGTLGPLPLQYRDFAAWHSAAVESNGEARAYWIDRLRGPLPILEMPADFARPALKTYRGASVHAALDAARLAALRSLAASNETTIFNVLLTAVKALLHRYTGATDIVVATPVAGREHADLEGQIGFYINTVVLRNELDPAAPFVEALAGVTRNTAAAMEHQAYPFDRLVDELRLPRDPSRMPVCDVTVVMANTGGPELSLPGIDVREFVRDYGTSKYDLHFVFDERGGVLEITLVYNPDLFVAARIEAMARHLLNILRDAAANPRRELRRLALLTPEERAAATARAEGPPSAGRATITGRFAAICAAHGDAIALVDPATGERLVYRELAARASRLAAALVRRGVRPGDVVGLFAGRSVDAISAMLGILQAGAAFVPVDAAYPSDRAAHILRDAGARIVLTTAAHRTALPGTAADVCEIAALAAEAASGTATPAATPDSIAYVIYTSGSTGKPKGVMVTHHNVTRLFSATEPRFGFAATDAWSVFHSIAFDFSVWEVWGALLYGGRAVLVPHEVARSPRDFARLLEAERVTMLSQTPSAFRVLAEEVCAGPFTLPLRFVVLGGEALDPRSLQPWVDRFGDESPTLVNMYGITETTVHVTERVLTRADVAAGRSVIGEPIRDLSIHLLDAAGEPVPVGVPGEIHVGGEGVAAGYLNQPGLTGERFLPNPFGGGRLYRSGDLARRTFDGALEYLGRADHQIKIRGFRIEPAEIEAALMTHEGVRQALVLAAGEGVRRHLVAYVVSSADAGDLRRHLDGRLPEYMLPAAVVTLDAFPMTAHGKIDRRALPQPGTAAPVAVIETAAGDVELAVTRVLCELLDVPRVGATTNFFDAGANSLLLINAHRLLQERLGREFPLVAMYQHPTARALASWLEGSAGTPQDARTDAAARASERRAARARAAQRRQS